MGRGRTRRKTRGSPGGDGGQLPDAPVFWFTFCWNLIYVQKLGVSSQSPFHWGKGPGHVPRLWLPEWLTILVPVGARAGDRSAGLPSSMLVHQGPGEQPSGQRDTHAWILTLRAQRCLKRRQTLGNQEEDDVSLSWLPWARGPSFQCWPKATCVCARCVRVVHAWTKCGQTALRDFLPGDPIV